MPLCKALHNGKTNLVINIGIALAKQGQRVFIIDADLGTANVDVLLNLNVRYNLNHLATREKEILDLVVEGPGGIHIIPGGSGLQSLANLDDYQFSRVLNSFKALEQYADVILIDTGAGLSRNVLNFVLAADEVIVVTTPEPHSITDAYAILKVIDEQNHSLKTWLVVNKAEDKSEAQQIADRMVGVANRFLRLKVTNLGYILEDLAVPRAVKKLVPFTLADPNSPAAKCLRQIAERLCQPETIVSHPQSRSFFDRFRDLFMKK
ncbi:MAG: MinD/ParA family protein [Firmicutes bacterium]|nr:MinD/ParA family protein [Bacillota bacterium]